MRRIPTRLLFGFGVLVAAIAWRCYATATGPVLFAPATSMPAIRPIDLLTAPLALLGLGILASAPGLALLRRVTGFTALIAAVAWPAVKFDQVGPVVFSLTENHGVHTTDVLLLPWLALGLTLLVPWRAAVAAAPLAASDGTARPAGATFRPA